MIYLSFKDYLIFNRKHKEEEINIVNNYLHNRINAIDSFLFVIMIIYFFINNNLSEI